MLKIVFSIILFTVTFIYAQGGQFTRVVNNADGTPTFDIAISLYRTPNTTERNQYEAIIQSMADAVWETTNQGHFLGTVRIFQAGRQGANANIIWNLNEWPRASTGRFNTRYGKIWVGDVFDGRNFLTAAADRTMMGYTLGHEWSHFVYSMFDQYVGTNPATTNTSSPWTTDIATVPSIMNYQWAASGGNFQWINYDTRNNYQAQNAHGRVWGLSGWELLTQPVADDPLHGTANVQPARTSYAALTGRAPAAASIWTNPNTNTVFTWMQVDLGTTGANPRRDLNIIWMQQEVEVILMIDRSGSMVGIDNDLKPINDVKAAAKQLVSFLQPGNSAIGVTSFTNPGLERTDVPMTDIPDPEGGIIATINAGIDNIFPEGFTALYDGANYGCDQLLAFDPTANNGQVRIGMLLSDGADNASTTTVADVVNKYNTANIPLFTFGYGDGYDHDKLQVLSSQTNGTFYANLTSTATLQAAFINAVAASMGRQLLPETWVSNNGFTFPVDPTMNAVTISMSYQRGDAGSSVNFEFRDPTNNLVSPAPTIVRAGAATPVVYPYTENVTITITNTTLVNSTRGTWFCDMAIAGNVSGISYRIASNSLGRTPELMVENQGGVSVAYPTPLLFTAAVVYESMVTDISMVATLKAPDGSTSSVTMYDDGTHGDVTASDGIYSAIYTDYSQNGDYQLTVNADNHTGMAKQTDAGLSYSIAPNGSTHPTYVPQPLGFNFGRQQTMDVNVSGVVADDHGNDPEHATILPIDNSKIAGKLEISGDMDYFQIGQAHGTGTLVIRISDVSAGMVPKITVYQPGGNTEIAYAVRDYVATDADYVLVQLDRSNLSDGTIVVVSDANHAAGGIYVISAGPEKTSDRRPPVAHIGDPYSGFEGSSVTFDASASTDVNFDVLRYRWDFDNDGVWDTDWLATSTIQHIWNDDYSGTVTMAVTDGTYEDIATTSVTIANVAPNVTLPDSMVAECCESTPAIKGAYTDPGSLDTHIISWDFGDGSTATANLTQSHKYCHPGKYHVLLTVRDNNGGVGIDTMMVRVVDRRPPVFKSIKTNPTELWPVNHKMIPVVISSVVADLCDPAPMTRIVSVSCNQPVNGKGDGNTSFDWKITGDLTLDLRAERAGNMGDRIYTIIVESKDLSGNAATREVIVRVPHNKQ